MRAFANLIVLAIILIGGSFMSAPLFAFHALRAAAEAEDIQGLAQLIDYPAVRASLRPQLSARTDALTPAPSFLEDPIGAVRRQLESQAPPPGGPDANAYLTPAALAALTRGEGRSAYQATDTDAARSPAPRPRHWGMNRTRMAIKDADGAETLFTWSRRGVFEWRLVHIGLPDAAVSSTS